MKNELTLRQLEDNASDLFKRVLRNDRHRETALAVIAEHPQAALAALQKGDEALGLTPKGSADILEEVLGSIASPVEAQQLVDDHLTPERQAELLRGRGDLPAIAAEVMSLHAVIRAMVADLGSGLNVGQMPEPEADEEDESPKEEELSLDDYDEDGKPRGEQPSISASKDDEGLEDMEPSKPSPFADVKKYRRISFDWYLGLRAWAMKVRERGDYADFLAYPLGGRHLRDYLIMACWLEVGQPLQADEVPMQMYDDLGIEPEFAMHRLRQFLDRGMLPYFSPQDVEYGLRARDETRQKLEKAPTVNDQAQAAAAVAANAIDL